jgi:hypothetical protein
LLGCAGSGLDESVSARINFARADQNACCGTRVTEVNELSRAAEDDPRGHGRSDYQLDLVTLRHAASPASNR